MTSNPAWHSMLVLHVRPKSGGAPGSHDLPPLAPLGWEVQGARCMQGPGAEGRVQTRASRRDPSLARLSSGPGGAPPSSGPHPELGLCTIGEPPGLQVGELTRIPSCTTSGRSAILPAPQSRTGTRRGHGAAGGRGTCSSSPAPSTVPETPDTARSAALTRGGHGGRSGEAKAEPRRRRRRGLSRSRPLLGPSQSLRAPQHRPAPGPRPASRLAGNN